MFSNVVLGSNDAARSKKFFDAVLGALGHGEGQMFGPTRVVYMTPGGMLIVGSPRNGEPMTISNGLTIGLRASSKEAVAAAHAAALANGGTCEGPPGPREMARGAEGAYFRDPDGNKFSVYAGAGG